MFEIGMMVICIDPFEPRGISAETLPQKGQIYIIRDIVTEYYPTPDGCGLRFEEIVNPPILYKEGLGEVAFDSESFRPVKRTSIEELRKLVAPIKTKERV